jgi:hypothetical protein
MSHGKHGDNNHKPQPNPAWCRAQAEVEKEVRPVVVVLTTERGSAFSKWFDEALKEARRYDLPLKPIALRLSDESGKHAGQ